MTDDLTVIASGVIVQGGTRLRVKLDAAGHYDDLLSRVFVVGEDVEVEIRRPVRKRSLKQNAGFHAMIAPWCREEGHDIAELKRDLLGEIFGWSETVSPISKRPVPLKPHTSKLSREEFSELIDRTLQIAAECGVLLLAPDEFRAERKKQQPKTRRGAA